MLAWVATAGGVAGGLTRRKPAAHGRPDEELRNGEGGHGPSLSSTRQADVPFLAKAAKANYLFARAANAGTVASGGSDMGDLISVVAGGERDRVRRLPGVDGGAPVEHFWRVGMSTWLESSDWDAVSTQLASWARFNGAGDGDVIRVCRGEEWEMRTLVGPSVDAALGHMLWGAA